MLTLIFDGLQDMFFLGQFRLSEFDGVISGHWVGFLVERDGYDSESHD